MYYYYIKEPEKNKRWIAWYFCEMIQSTKNVTEGHISGHSFPQIWCMNNFLGALLFMLCHINVIKGVVVQLCWIKSVKVM